MGASRLQQAAQILDVTVPFFFEGAPGGHKLGEGAPSTAYVDEFVSSSEGLRLIKGKRPTNPALAVHCRAWEVCSVIGKLVGTHDDGYGFGWPGAPAAMDEL